MTTNVRKNKTGMAKGSFEGFIDGHPCQVCGATSGTALKPSSLAPVSGMVCQECFLCGAENLEVVMLWLWEYGGPEQAPEFAKQVISFADEEYIQWSEVKKRYPEHAEELQASWGEDDVLVDVL